MIRAAAAVLALGALAAAEPAGDDLSSLRDFRWIWRPLAGAGVASRFEVHSPYVAAFHAGGRFLVSPNGSTAMGVEAIYHQTEFALDDRHEGDARRFAGIGLALEQRFAGWFHAGVAMVGLIGLEQRTSNPFDVVTTIGWQPRVDRGWSPYLVFRNDTIASRPLLTIRSLSAGLQYTF